MRSNPNAALGLLLALSGCGGAQQVPPVSALPAAPLSAPRAEALTPASPRGPSCLSTPLVPPTGYLQETHFGAPSEQDVVGSRALAALRAKVCGSDCAPLDADFLWPDRRSVEIVKEQLPEKLTVIAVGGEGGG